ncbi:MAG: flavin reductase family protein, partial [Lachnospiraceae bacterium]|nr:flavin reductase family protein [Lachnospiraceae bacterium]
MAKEMWKPGNMLYPVPPVLVTCQNKKGESNMLTVAWAGTVCSTPAMLSISVRKERYSHAMLMETGEFVVNLPTEDLVRETDEAGVRSGRDINKWEKLHLHQEEGKMLSIPMISECPINMECKVKQVLE